MGHGHKTTADIVVVSVTQFDLLTRCNTGESGKRLDNLDKRARCAIKIITMRQSVILQHQMCTGREIFCVRDRDVGSANCDALKRNRNCLCRFCGCRSLC